VVYSYNNCLAGEFVPHCQTPHCGRCPVMFWILMILRSNTQCHWHACKKGGCTSKTVSTSFDDIWRAGLGACSMPPSHAEKSFGIAVRYGNAVQFHSFMFML